MQHWVAIILQLSTYINKKDSTEDFGQWLHLYQVPAMYHTLVQ